MSPILGSRGISPRGYGFAGAGKPNAPVSVSATDVGTARAYNNGAATVSFTSGGDNGSPITSYTVTSSPGGFTASGASSPLTVTGLQSGVSYTFTATATNSVGTSDASSASSAITATTIPQAPTIGTATCATGQTYTGSANISVAFTAGATGGKAVSYTATSSGGGTQTGGSSPISFSRTVGSSYTFTVTATNANGTSSASGTSNSVLSASKPQTPTISSVGINSSTNVTVNWSGATGGSAITSVAVTSSPSLSLSYSGTSTALSVTGTFASNQAYTFTMTTTNAYGTSSTSNGVASTPNPIIPAMYLAGGTWNTTTTGGGFTDYGKKNTGTFRFDTETASTTSDNMTRFWLKPASVSNPATAGYIAGGITSTGTSLYLGSGNSYATNTVDKFNFATLAWSTLGTTLTAVATYWGQESSVENSTTAGYIFIQGNGGSGTTTTTTANKMTYSTETMSSVQSWSNGLNSSYNVPFSGGSFFFFANQNNTPDISNPGTKGYLRGNAINSTSGNVSFYLWNFSTNTYGSVINTAAVGGCYNHQWTNGSTAGFSTCGNNSALAIWKMPFSTETWANTGTTPSVGRYGMNARSYTAGGAAYLTAGGNSGTYNTTTDKYAFSTDTRSTISQSCNGTHFGTSLASAH